MQSTHHARYDSQRTSHIANKLTDFIARYGYEKLETPIIEAAELFLTKAGDQIIKKLFTFERYGKELALRPEFTAPAAYRYIKQHGDDQPIARWQFGGFVFEDDPNDYSHNYQRFSIGAELIGMPGPVAEAEIISMAVQGASLLGISNWRLIIGHTGLVRQLLARFGLDIRTERLLLAHLPALRDTNLGRDYVLEQVEKQFSIPSQRDADASSYPDSTAEESTQHVLDILLDTRQHGTTMGGRTRTEIARRLLQKRNRVNEKSQIIAALDFLQQWTKIDAPVDEAFATIKKLVGSDDETNSIRDWQLVIDLLAAYGIPTNQVIIQPDLARSWDYYTGIVFEIRSDTGLQLGGGGRYDELMHLIGGKHLTPAVGFAYYMNQILAALPAAETIQEPTIVILIDDENALAAAHWAQLLRSRSIATKLLPEVKVQNPNETVVSVDRNGGANLGPQFYRPEQIDTLVNDLTRVSI